jgi:hypothetical protein
VTVSTLRVVPETSPVSGTAPTLEPAHQLGRGGLVLDAEARRLRLQGRLSIQDELVLRAARDDYWDWLHHVSAAAGCARPIRLAGWLTTTADTGTRTVIVSERSTESMPDGVIYKACGNRRASVCPSCSDMYRRDAFQIILGGMVGGKGVPETVAGHPAMFATFTAPSFGYVHTRREGKGGAILACRPRRKENRCQHGVDIRCAVIHDKDDRNLGQPFCLDCYDHASQVVFNLSSGELWRRTIIRIRRNLRAICRAGGIDPATVAVSYGKVVEMQRRAAVHYHAIFRLDGHDPDNPTELLPIPAGIGLDDLKDAIRAAGRSVFFTTAEHPTRPEGWHIAWGEQLDLQPIRVAPDQPLTDPDTELVPDHTVMTRRKAAGYLAKYATKSTEITGHVSKRITAETIGIYGNPAGTHTERLIAACWTLGKRDPNLRLSEQDTRPYKKLRTWAHMLGFGGHFLTQSARYFVTFTKLRQARVIWRRTQLDVLDEADQETAEVTQKSELVYVGAGWHTTGDALLANTSAAMAREMRRVAKEELAAMAA